MHTTKFCMKLKIVTILAVIIVAASGCNFFDNAVEYKKTSQDFMHALMAADYDKAVSFMALEHEFAAGANIDSLKSGFARFKLSIDGSFDGELNYKFIKAEKTFSSIKSEQMPPNTTLVFLELSSTSKVGIVRFMFDDVSKKILNINTVGNVLPIPDRTFFWLFGILVLIVLSTNIYALVLIKRSNLTKKWLKYLSVFLLNVPTLSYSFTGFGFKLIHFQFLLGVGFEFAGYLNSIWSVGIPVAAIYWIVKLKFLPQLKEMETPQEPTDDLPSLSQ